MPSGAIRARLEYTRDATAMHCPEAEALRDAVAGRLGYPVFEPSAEARIVRVAITRAGSGLRAEVEVHAADGAVLGARALSSAGVQCQELASTLVLSIVMALDPLVLGAGNPNGPALASPQAESTTAAACAAPAACPTCVPSVVPTQDHAGRSFAHVALGGAALVGAVPSLTAGAMLEVGINVEHVGLAVSGLVDLGAGTSSSGGAEVRAQRSVMEVAACGRRLPERGLDWGACVLGSLGVLRGSRGDAADHDRTVAASLGLRPFVELPLYGRWWARAQGELAINLERTSLMVGDQVAWRTPLLWGSLGLALVMRFL
jgi:hypothetical protein